MRASTSTGVKGFTPYYASPEQLKDEKVDGRTDIWQLGIILYELLTGKNPFEAESEHAVYTKILDGEIIPPPKSIQI